MCGGRRIIELRRIDKDAYNHDIVLGAGTLHKRAMACMERTHSRHESYAFAFLSGCFNSRVEAFYAADYFHFCFDMSLEW